MSRLFVIVIGVLCAVKTLHAAYNLPAGVQEQIGLKEIKETFKCEADGYFADVDNNCKIYHQCNSFGKKGSSSGKFGHSTMACGINQVFDQSKLACNYESDSIPCEASSDFFYLNDRIGDEKAPFLTDADIEKARNARPEYRAKAK